MPPTNPSSPSEQERLEYSYLVHYHLRSDTEEARVQELYAKYPSLPTPVVRSHEKVGQAISQMAQEV